MNIDGSVSDLQKTGLPSDAIYSSQEGQFLADEQDAGRANPSGGNPFQGFHLGKGDSVKDFFALVTLAETFAQNTGWQYFPSARQLQFALEHGFASMDTRAVFHWMAGLSGNPDRFPWANAGMSQTQWQQAGRTLDETVNELTGVDGWDAAGLDPALKAQALANNWGSTELQAHLVKDPNVMAKYGWLKHEMNYQSFQQYKTTNADQLRERYGTNVTDQLAVQNLDTPLTSVHASGAAFSYNQPQGGSHDNSGFQSTVR